MKVNQHPWGSTSENFYLRKIALFPIAPGNIGTYMHQNIYIYRYISKKGYDSIANKKGRQRRTDTNMELTHSEMLAYNIEISSEIKCR